MLENIRKSFNRFYLNIIFSLSQKLVIKLLSCGERKKNVLCFFHHSRTNNRTSWFYVHIRYICIPTAQLREMLDTWDNYASTLYKQIHFAKKVTYLLFGGIGPLPSGGLFTPPGALCMGPPRIGE